MPQENRIEKKEVIIKSTSVLMSASAVIFYYDVTRGLPFYMVFNSVGANFLGGIYSIDSSLKYVLNLQQEKKYKELFAALSIASLPALAFAAINYYEAASQSPGMRYYSTFSTFLGTLALNILALIQIKKMINAVIFKADHCLFRATEIVRCATSREEIDYRKKRQNIFANLVQLSKGLTVIDGKKLEALNETTLALLMNSTSNNQPNNLSCLNVIFDIVQSRLIRQPTCLASSTAANQIGWIVDWFLKALFIAIVSFVGLSYMCATQISLMNDVSLNKFLSAVLAIVLLSPIQLLCVFTGFSFASTIAFLPATVMQYRRLPNALALNKVVGATTLIAGFIALFFGMFSGASTQQLNQSCSNSSLSVVTAFPGAPDLAFASSSVFNTYYAGLAAASLLMALVKYFGKNPLSSERYDLLSSILTQQTERLKSLSHNKFRALLSGEEVVTAGSASINTATSETTRVEASEEDDKNNQRGFIRLFTGSLASFRDSLFSFCPSKQRTPTEQTGLLQAQP